MLGFFRRFCCLLLSALSPLGAQSGPGGSVGSASTPIALRDYSERLFATPDGLRSLAVFAVEALPDGTLWIGTEAGPHRFEGAQFELITIPGTSSHVRTIVQTPDGNVWFGTRNSVVRRTPRGDLSLFNDSHGLPQGTVYSLSVSDALDGTPRLIASTSSGVAFFSNDRWVPLALPPGLRLEGLVIKPRARTRQRDELWLATSYGVAARWSDGRWQKVYGPRDGLSTRAVEHFHVVENDARTLYAATSEGVYQLDERSDTIIGNDRWQRVADSPVNAYRLATVAPKSGGHELWVGTLDGLLLRQRARKWDTIQLRSSEPRTPVHSLRSVSGHAGGQAVYVGTFGDGLVRLSVGRAATLISARAGLRLSISSILEQPFGRRGVAWIGTSNFGVYEIDSVSARQIVSVDDVMDGRANTMFIHTGEQGAEAWVGAALGAWRREAGRWVDRSAGAGRVRFMRFAIERENEDASALLAATDAGVMRWDNDRWQSLDGAPNGSAWEIVGERADDPTVWVAGSFGTAVRRNGAWRVDTSYRETGRTVEVYALCRMPADAGSRLLAAGNHGVFWRNPDDTAWRALPPQVRERLPSEYVRDVRCDEPDRVLLATSAGLAVLDMSAKDSTSWRVEMLIGPQDGLPSPIVQSIGDGGAPGARWIGTAHGIGWVDARSLAAPSVNAFGMRVVQGGNEELDVLDGATVPANANRVRVLLSLPTFHREADLRYRIELEGPLATTAATWSLDREAAYPALPSGRYTVRGWARDYAGREYGPIVQRFAIAYPRWRSPLALLAYALSALALIVAAHRWRLRTLQDRAEELEASERRARASEKRFRTLFERAFDANMLVRDNRIIAANSAAATLLGAGRELVATSLQSLSFPLELAARGAVSDAVETEVRSADGQVVPVAVTVTTIERDDGPVQHWVLRDLSASHAASAERQLLEAQVREAQKLESLGTLAGGVAHDFNNLLGVIRGNAELARDTLHDPDEVASHLSAVLDASERARDLVRQILTFSRRQTPHERIVDVGAVVRALMPMLRSLIPRTVDLVVTGGESVYAIRGDVTQLQQLLFNLCSNAEYAMRPTNGGTLEVRLDVLPAPDDVLSETSRVVRLRVRDTGVGMPADVRDRVFEPFFTTKPVGEGTGLGLSVLHGIVASHGGRVRVQSEPGAGTTFDVVFPLVAESASASGGVSGGVSGGASGGASGSASDATGQGAEAGLHGEPVNPSSMTTPAAAPDTSGASAAPAAPGTSATPATSDKAATSGTPEIRATPVSGTPASVVAPLGAATPVAGSQAVDVRGSAASRSVCVDARVVLVDDEPAVARVVERALSKLGCKVRTFNDPREALSAITHAPADVDLLVTDQTMPGMTGDVLAEAVHALRASLPVVIVTGYSHRLTAERLAAVGAAAVLQKPVPLAELEQAVSAALSARKK